ncbi:MAG: acyl-CoA thioesterase [Oceanococcus sp.]
MSRHRSQRSEFSWFKPIDVRWGDMDALGHVNNAQYFVYTESARIKFFDELFKDDAAFMNGQGPILASIACNYHEQVHYPALLDVAMGCESIGNRSLEIVCPIFLRDQEQAVADVRATIVWFDYEQQRPIGVPQRLRDYWKK